MTHLLFHKTPNLVSSEPGAAHLAVPYLPHHEGRPPSLIDNGQKSSLRYFRTVLFEELGRCHVFVDGEERVLVASPTKGLLAHDVSKSLVGFDLPVDASWRRLVACWF